MARRPAVSCGRDLTSVPDLRTALESAGQCRFDFICVPLMHPRYKREFFRIIPERPGPTTRSDKVLTSAEWSSLIVAKLSPWIQLDSPSDVVRRNSEKAFKDEMLLCIHLSVPAIMIRLTSGYCVNLARNISHFMLQNNNHVLWIHIPMRPYENEVSSAGDKEGSKEDTWMWWNKLRTLCANNKKLAIVLEICCPLPSYSALERWLGEPVRAIVMPTDLFLINKRGYPVLSRPLQAFVQKLFKFDAQVVLTGACKVAHGIHAYQEYLNHLYKTQPSASSIEAFSKGYEDYLQSPLQPLMDNLDSQTYEIFEKDPIKYTQYEKAVSRALKDRISDDEKEKITVIMVVGAGRGPLVDASLRGAKSVDRLVKIYAVEKNPGAVVTLLNRQSEEWGSHVSVVSCDMRAWDAPEKADILVSELLGSFGDNELSPECLDGAQSFLKPGGISIPSSYTSYLAPLSSPKLHMEVSFCKEKEKAYTFAHYETPYVVRLQNATTLAEPQPCFTFNHPNNDVPINNDRYASLRFHVNESCVLHGFSGYFDTVLYDDITLSIVPQTHSNGMISWFPIYFPIKEPLFVPASCEVEVHMWRLCTDKKVWYEWCVTEPQITNIHNPKGRSYWIGL